MGVGSGVSFSRSYRPEEERPAEERPERQDLDDESERLERLDRLEKKANDYLSPSLSFQSHVV